MKKLDVYDFDGTIYNGDSSIDFFFYAIQKKKRLIKYIPIMLIFTLLKKLHLVSTKKFKEKCFLFIKDIDNLDNLITQFWEEKNKKINNFFLENLNKQEEDQKRSIYVISASPEFLVKPYISQYKNINLIATKMNKNGTITGENCKGDEKIDRLKKEEKEFEIENFYTDSLDDLPLVEIAQNTYYVHNGDVEKWDIKKVKDKRSNKKSRLIFLMFFIFYIIIGVQLSYNYNLITKLDFIFGSDTFRVARDMTDIFGNHDRLSVHPLFVLLLQPIYFILSGITQDKALALILISSTVSAISVAVMYKIFELFSKSEKSSFWLSICYGLTFSTIIFTANIEVYNIAAMGLILLWYFIIAKIKGEWNKSDFLILVALGIFSLSITITNFAIFLIGCLTLLIAKKIKFSKLVLVNVIVISLFLILYLFQFCVWRNTPLVPNLNTIISNETKFMNWQIGKDNFKNVIKNDIYNSIISTKLYVGILENTNIQIIQFQTIDIINKIVITAFLGFIAIFTIKNFKKNLPINIGIILCLAFNVVLHLIYGNNECFLYSQHFVYLIFLLFGINCLCEENKRIKLSTLIFTILLFLFEVILNGRSFLQILEMLTTYAVPNYYALNFEFYKLAVITGIIAVFLIVVLSFILYFTKKVIHSKENSERFKFIIYIITFILLFESTFVALKTIPKYSQISYNETETASPQLIINKDYTVFNKDYKSDVTAYLDYVEEYKNFIEQYKCTMYDQIPDTEFYLFGMGNRRKILFRENKLIDIETEEIIEQFDVDKCLIIPNEYTVLIKEKNGKFDKIFETQNGVFISKNGKSNIIEDTNIDINLYTFDNQTYKNIKKVLYSEILFNIKDSKIYPNIIVYDEPWYRDAAMACMVLKQTNNTNLISDWVKSITEVYDRQNGGEKEPDNLGELLYILSTQEEKNEELISKIESEANRLANENTNGYYIYGLTDSSNQYKYQNMWYDFGMRSIGQHSEFKYNAIEDEYSNLAWWIDKNATNIYENTNYPYLTWANYHASSKKEKKLVVNNKIYPLSWEKGASRANYNEMSIIDEKFVQNRISPAHLWSATEMLLFILDETGNLKI